MGDDNYDPQDEGPGGCFVAILISFCVVSIVSSAILFLVMINHHH